MATYLGTATGTTSAIRGDTASPATANGVVGTSSTVYSAVYGTSTYASGGAGVYGDNSASAGYGVYGTNSSSGTGVYGTSSSGYGVLGTSPNGGYGVWGTSTSSTGTGIGVFGGSLAANGYGVYASGGAYVAGSLNVTGTVTKGGGGFLIDHPLDPANKLLEHSFVESPERKNIYDGIGTADAAGELSVQLPAYFEALNKEFRYQLTPLGRGMSHAMLI